LARARNIKPGFFSNDELVELPFEGRLLFIGLWTIADREGRLLDRPKKIKMDLFPGDGVDIDALLTQLAERGFIWRYEAEGMRCIQVINWHKHQNPHVKEAPSALPEPCDRRDETGRAPDKHGANTVQALEIPERAGLIPDSLNLIPDSGFLIPDSLPIATADAAANKTPSRRRAAKPAEAPNPLNLETWKAYKQAYADRYGASPIQNTQSNSLIKQLVQSLGAEAPDVAAFYVRHNGRNYVAAMHQLKLLQSDHAKLRTEWVTNQQMTATKAAQTDKTATNLDAFAPLIAEARAREAEEERMRHAQQ
jgi:hypothetical protein